MNARKPWLISLVLLLAFGLLAAFLAVLPGRAQEESVPPV